MFRVSRATFIDKMNKIRTDNQKDSLVEDAVSPECRLGICLYCLGRGDYLFTISELTGYGVSTICGIVNEVAAALVNNLSNDAVLCHFPRDIERLKSCMAEMESEWQFPCCFGALDGCHIPIKCPKGGPEASKEYHNFKNFYSIVLMGLIESKYRFIWASAGFPGNSHDSIVFQSTELYNSICEGNLIPSVAKNESGTDVYPLILGDSAFPFKT